MCSRPKVFALQNRKDDTMTANAPAQALRIQAEKAPFEAFGILYYPLFAHRVDLACSELDDDDMTWAVTADANLEGTGYTLSQSSITTLAAYHHVMAGIAASSKFLPLAKSLSNDGINPLADLKRLVPNVTATPMYPDFPEQVMEISEAEFRYHQALHYYSTYGVEQMAGLLGLDVTVGKGWLPVMEATPKERADETLIAPKVLHVILTVEDLRSIVADRMARATRMHPAEIATALLVFENLNDAEAENPFPHIAFHENMLELIRIAGKDSSALLERVASGLAQHPGDLLKATMHLVETNRSHHLTTCQKKGLCHAFEHFPVMAIASNIADAGRDAREAYNYLSVARFGGENLCEAIELVQSGQVRSWASELERLWDAVTAAADAKCQYEKGIQGFFSHLFAKRSAPEEDVIAAWRALLTHYGQRPGMLFRSFARLIKGGCPDDLLIAEAKAHAESYAIPTIVRTLVAMGECDAALRVERSHHASFSIAAKTLGEDDRAARKRLFPLLRELLAMRLATLETPIRNRRVYLDIAGISLKGSILIPNETGDTGTAWPPIGLAWDLPADKTVRFFTFWDDRKKRVDVDLHFVGRTVDGKDIHVGWNSSFRGFGMVTSGDVTHSENAVEFLDADMATARKEGAHFVAQQQHIYSGAKLWENIDTCYSGAIIVSDTSPDVRLVNSENIIFRDELTGKGSWLTYAVVNFQNHYVRLLRGASIPLGDVDFSLGDYLETLFEAQGATLATRPEEADIRLCVGRSDESDVVSLFDEGFFIG